VPRRERDRLGELKDYTVTGSAGNHVASVARFRPAPSIPPDEAAPTDHLPRAEKNPVGRSGSEVRYDLAPEFFDDVTAAGARDV
jgi:hypothetical protein